MTYITKYFKYKKKYLELKMHGGSLSIDNLEYDEAKDITYMNTNVETESLKFDSLFFGFQRLTEINFNLWDSYIQKMKEKSIVIKKSSKKKIHVIDGYWAFQQTLDFIRPPKMLDSNNYIYIAFASKEKLVPYEFGNKIEMCFCVLVNETIPISTHMGINRNFKFISDTEDYNYEEVHKNLSVVLHAFAGMITKRKHPHIEYMITVPTEIMTKILLDALKGRGITLGTNIIEPTEPNEKEKSRVTITQKDYYYSDKGYFSSFVENGEKLSDSLYNTNIICKTGEWCIKNNKDGTETCFDIPWWFTKSGYLGNSNLRVNIKIESLEECLKEYVQKLKIKQDAIQKINENLVKISYGFDNIRRNNYQELQIIQSIYNEMTSICKLNKLQLRDIRFQRNLTILDDSEERATNLLKNYRFDLELNP
jgi:hypothetical protein